MSEAIEKSVSFFALSPKKDISPINRDRLSAALRSDDNQYRRHPIAIG